MSNRSSTPQRPPSPDQSLPTTSEPSAHSQSSTTPAPSMIQVARPSVAPTTSLGYAIPQYTPHTPHYPPHSPSYTPETRIAPTVAQRSTPPPDIMRSFEQSRGTKRRRSEDRSNDEEERQASLSGSESDGNHDQPVLPAPKKRTRTLMTPDQLTALHRLLAMTRFPTTEQREQCGREIGLSARRVQVWFQNQRQKSKAQQQAAAQAGSSRGHVLASRSSGSYQVFSYESLRYEHPARPFSSPYPRQHEEPRYPVVAGPRRFSRPDRHRRDTSGSYPIQPSSAPHDFSREYYPPHYMEEVEFAHSPTSRYEPHSPGDGSRSPEVHRRAERDDILPPIWPEHAAEADHVSTSDASRSETSSLRRPSRPALLPTGLPPPQPLEPTPLWSHPHTNPRYMRPLPPAGGLPSLLGGLNRGRARSDPPAGSFSASSQILPQPPMGLGLSLMGIRPAHNSEKTHDHRPSSPQRTNSDPIGLDVHYGAPSRSETRVLTRETSHPLAQSPRRQTARGSATHSRRSSRDSTGSRLD